MKKLPELIEEEVAWVKPPAKAGAARCIRWSLLHGESLNADEVADRWDVSPSMLSQAIYVLRKAGYTITRSGNPARFQIVEGRAPEFLPAPAPRVVADSFLAPAPPTPPLGTVLRVGMVAEDNGQAVMALRGRDGVTWFARIEGGESL